MAMRDPHVRALTYKLVAIDPTVRVADDAPERRADLAGFECVLANHVLRAFAHEHFPSEASARAALEPNLRAWESKAELVDRLPIEFRFVEADVIDRDPILGGVSPGPVVLELCALAPTLHFVHHAYPAPQVGLAESDQLKRLRMRVRDMRTGREPVLSCAYAALSLLENRFGSGREKAARSLRIDVAVLDDIGRITAKFDPENWRKAKGEVQRVSAGQQGWLKTVVARLAFRAVEVESKVPDLAMLDLPRCPDR